MRRSRIHGTYGRACPSVKEGVPRSILSPGNLPLTASRRWLPLGNLVAISRDDLRNRIFGDFPIAGDQPESF